MSVCWCKQPSLRDCSLLPHDHYWIASKHIVTPQGTRDYFWQSVWKLFQISKYLLSMLESLDLSFNQLEGEIPQQLASINTLARLNMSCNQLDGQIPKGSQFNAFHNDSYVGNLGLCGFPLSKECEHDIEMQKEGEDDDYFFSGFTWEVVVIGYGCGVVPASIIVNMMLLAGKPKWFALELLPGNWVSRSGGWRLECYK